MPRANVRKNTVIHNELKIVGKSGIYCFLPYATLDKHGKAVFKIGMTTRDFADRIEDYHTYYPMGVYMVFMLTYEKMRGFSRLSAAEKKTKKKVLEEAVMHAVAEDFGGKRMQFHSRPGRTGVAPRSEWVYASYEQIEQAFEKIQTEHGGTLHKGHLGDIDETYKLDKKAKNTYEAKILYTVGL